MSEPSTTDDAIATTPKSPSIMERAAAAKQEQRDYLDNTNTTTTTPSKEPSTSTPATKSSPKSPSIMERATAAKEQQRQYLISKGEKIPEPGPSKTEESKTNSNFGGSGPPKGLPPPPGKWGGSGPPPKNETAKQKRERQRREQDAKRLRQSSKFGGQKRATTPGGTRRDVRGETQEEKIKRRQDALDRKKAESLARFSPAQQKLLQRGKESREYWSKQRPSKEQEQKTKDELAASKKEEESKKNTFSANRTPRKPDMNDIWNACEVGDVKFIKNHVQHSRWDVRRHHDRGPNGFGGTPLHKACWGSHPSLVKWLLEHVERKYGAKERRF